MKISDVTDYELLFKRDSTNLSRVARITALSLGGAVVLGPLAFAAAPAIGGVVGAAAGLSGAAASSAGLAAIGGGSIASGGLGMAGGAAIIAASGAALGGTLGGVVSNTYFREIKGFSIELIKEGKSPALLCIDGFLTEIKQQPTDWKVALAELYPDNSWYYVRREAKRLFDIGKSFVASGGKVAAEKIITQWAAQATKQAAKKTGPLGYAMSILGIAVNPWFGCNGKGWADRNSISRYCVQD